MTFKVDGFINGDLFTLTWNGEIRGDTRVVAAMPVEGQSFATTPTGPFMLWDETDPIAVWAWLITHTKITDVWGTPPDWEVPAVPPDAVA